MKVSAVKYGVLTWVSGFTMLILFLVPFHALLTVWAASHFGHYTALRLWKEVLLALSIAGALFLVAIDHKIRYHTLSRRLVWLITAYMALNVAWGLLALNEHDVTAKALGYGLIVNLRFLAFFLVTWAVALRLARLRRNWQWLVIWPAALVVVFGLLQAFVLPHDFLRHFGYSAATIPPVETINHNQHYIRVFSTLRGANPLGAYLVVPISLLAVLLIRNGRNWRQAALLAGALITLFFSFSRSAWIGAVLSVITVLFLSRLSHRSQRLALLAGAGLILLAAVFGAAFRHSSRFENFVLHTQAHSSARQSSNQGHFAATKNGLEDVIHHPLGVGPGTAGPASAYNSHAPRIAENYFVQIAQETGWLGLAMFVLINTGVGALLYMRRDDPLALSLFASLIGLTFISLLSHAWTDDTLAYVWWGLAGLAMAPLPESLQAEANESKTVKP
jgi:O-antigen ligase/polysaccharide polymerase Wzy-like membrane protein